MSDMGAKSPFAEGRRKGAVGSPADIAAAVIGPSSAFGVAASRSAEAMGTRLAATGQNRTYDGIVTLPRKHDAVIVGASLVPPQVA
jgi:hypothetical protein